MRFFRYQGLSDLALVLAALDSARMIFASTDASVGFSSGDDEADVALESVAPRPCVTGVASEVPQLLQKAEPLRI